MMTRIPRRVLGSIAAATIVCQILMAPAEAMAQRMSHGGGGSRGGGGGGGRSASHGTPSHTSPSHETASRPSANDRATINGGNQRVPDNSGAESRDNNRGGTTGGINDGNRGGGSAGNTNIKGGGNKTNVGNKTNINSGNTNVNINIDNSHNTTVRRNTNVHYNRPPYVYGGRGYYCAHPYYYHPYTPYYWGPTWHPWGFFVAALAVTAIVVSVNNQQYHYDSGTFYAPSGSGYTVVQAPVGATVTTIPSNAQTVVVNETTNNYYYGGAYYEKSAGGYTVVPPTAGTVVESLPEGAEEVKVGDQTYVKYGETYYQPIEKDGKPAYEVVQVEDQPDAKN